MKITGICKKVIILGSTALLSTFILTACGSSSTNSSSEAKLPAASYKLDASEPAWKVDKTKETTLTWYVNADWWNKSFGKDMVTKQIKKDLNINIKFVTGDDTKLNTYFASGQLPDIITTFDGTSKVSQTANQWAYPLSTLAKKYDPYFNKVAKKETLDWYQLNDGKTYGYPSYSNTAADYKSGSIPANSAFIIRKDVLNAIGKQDFTTPDGFVKGMSTIKEKFPNLVPFGFNEFGTGTSSLGDTLQNMLGVPIKTSNNKFYNRNTDTDYLKWLATLRKVHGEGNISDDSFTDDTNAFNGKLATGKYATLLLGSTMNHQTDLQTFAASNANDAYVAVDGIQSTIGNKPTLAQAGISGFSVNYISNKSKNAAKAIQLFTYLLSKRGEMLTTFGVKGKTYNLGKDDTVSWTKSAAEVQSKNPDKWKNEYRVGEFILFGHDRYKALNKNSNVKAVWQMIDWGQKYLTPQFDIENINPDQGTAEARAYSAIQTNWNTTLVSLIRSKSQTSFDSIMNSYKSFEKSNSIDKIKKIRDKQIKQNIKKLSE